MRANTRGLTIVEVLVALVIAAIAIGMFSYLIDSLDRFRTAQSKTVALNFARRYIDVTRSLWQDPGFFGDAALPSLSPPDNFSCMVYLDHGLQYTCAAGHTASAGAASLDPYVYRNVRVKLDNVRGDEVILSSQVAAPFAPQPLPSVESGTSENGGH